MRALITGFEPIWGIKRTPSGDLAKLWQDGSLAINGLEVQSLILPQVFGRCTEITCQAIRSFNPNFILMFGATQKNDPIRLERFAVNVERTPMGDNTKIPVLPDRPVLRGGPAAYESTLPIHWLIQALETEGVSCKASYSAGTHTCNSLMYGVLHFLAMTQIQAHAGFIHVPFPNEYGVIEDELWTTEPFDGIVKASLTLVEKMQLWFEQTYGQTQ